MARQIADYAMRLVIEAAPGGPTIDISFSLRSTRSEYRSISYSMESKSTIRDPADSTSLSNDLDRASSPANAVAEFSTHTSSGNLLPSELPDTSAVDSAGKALSPTVEMPILEALYNVVNAVSDLRELVGPSILDHTESLLQYRLVYWQTGRMFLQRQSADPEREPWQNLARTNTNALEMVYKLGLKPNRTYALSSCGWRDLRDPRDGELSVSFSRLVVEKTSLEPDQKGNIIVDVSFQYRQQPKNLSRLMSKFKRPFLKRS